MVKADVIQSREDLSDNDYDYLFDYDDDDDDA
jgi:hypothetical protein